MERIAKYWDDFKVFQRGQVFGELPSKAIYEQLLHLLLDLETKLKIYQYLCTKFEMYSFWNSHTKLNWHLDGAANPSSKTGN